ncbi:MAG: GAF domain-containing protein [Gemmataceae bacterium]
MMPLVPKKSTVAKPGRLFQQLSDVLLSALEFLDADAGWVGLQDGGGGLTYPVRGGVFADGWLCWQQGHGAIWGFAIDGGPAFLNAVQPWSTPIDPPLRNLLSCPLMHNDRALGHVVLANKAHGFAETDVAVLRGLAHHMARLLSSRPPIELSAAWRRILDHAAEGVLVLDASATMIYANATWLDWTGFRAEELIGQTAPFPFWIRPQDLAPALSIAPAVSANVLPFRRRDHSLFWCQLETVAERWDDEMLTVAFLQSAAVSPPAVSESTVCASTTHGEQQPSLRPAAPEWLALLLDLDDGIEGWSSAWEERTGLAVGDMKDNRCELVLDWLFPQQRDRDRVADCFHHPQSMARQLVLEVASTSGSPPALCTFLPLPSLSATARPRRWLLLLGDTQPSTIAATKHLESAAPHDLPDADKT